MTDETPSVETRRGMLVAKRLQFRDAGYEAEMEVAILSVQTVDDKPTEDAQQKLIADNRKKSENCYKAAAELTRLLSELPEKEA